MSPVPGDMRLEIVDRVGWIRMDREGRLNVLTADALAQLEQLVAQCEADDSVRVVVLQGNAKSFIVGADLTGLAKADVGAALTITDRTMRVQERVADLPMPTIAALSGFVLGAGLEVALCCDFRIATDDATLGMPEVNLGIIPGGGGTQRLPRLIGPAAATELVLLGETVTADRARALGLVNEVTSAGELTSRVAALAAKLAARPALAVRAAKRALRGSQDVSLKEGLRLEQALFALLFGTRDREEGLAAFAEKRSPRFEGR